MQFKMCQCGSPVYYLYDDKCVLCKGKNWGQQGKGGDRVPSKQDIKNKAEELGGTVQVDKPDFMRVRLNSSYSARRFFYDVVPNPGIEMSTRGEVVYIYFSRAWGDEHGPNENPGMVGSGVY